MAISNPWKKFNEELKWSSLSGTAKDKNEAKNTFPVANTTIESKEMASIMLAVLSRNGWAKRGEEET